MKENFAFNFALLFVEPQEIDPNLTCFFANKISLRIYVYYIGIVFQSPSQKY